MVIVRGEISLNNKFDLTVKRPQVLLFGNGLVYYKNWDEVIEDLKDDNINDSLKKKNIPYRRLFG